MPLTKLLGKIVKQAQTYNSFNIIQYDFLAFKRFYQQKKKEILFLDFK